MDVFEHFSPTNAEKGVTWQYYPLTDCQTINGSTGTFYKLSCTGNDGEAEVIATCDGKYKEHLRPYLELLHGYKEDPISVETPVVPVFHGDDGRWRFSWYGAERDYPDTKRLREQKEAPSPPNGKTAVTATRLQVSVSSKLATEFKTAALRRGMSHTDLLLQLVRDTVTSTG